MCNINTQSLKEITNLINNYFDIEDYSASKKLLNKSLEKFPNDHVLLSQLAITHYELREYNTALEIIKKAKIEAPTCPLVQNYSAIILYIHEKDHEAIKVWESLLSRGLQDIAFGKCGEGIRATKSLFNDIRMRLGKAYLVINDKQKAKKYFKMHLENRQRGLFSNFTKKEVENEYKNLI